MKRLTLVLCAMVLCGVPVHADTIYSYVGDTSLFTQGLYESGMDRITGSFMLSDSFVRPTSENGLSTIFADVSSGIFHYSFSDGNQTLTETNSTASFRVGFNFDGTSFVPGSSDGSTLGNLLAMWSLRITTPTSGMFIQFANREFQSVAWIGGASFSPFTTCPNGHLCYTDPSISTMMINSNFNASEIGGGKGIWTVAPSPVSASEPDILVPLVFATLLVFATARNRRSIRPS